jgi:hypothetical protein
MLAGPMSRELVRTKPFALTPDPAFLYPSRQHAMALTMLEYGLESQATFSVLTGDIGSGKTTLVRRLLRQLGDQVAVGLISNTHAGEFAAAARRSLRDHVARASLALSGASYCAVTGGRPEHGPTRCYLQPQRRFECPHAQYYADRRHIPSSNLIGLAVPDRPVIGRHDLRRLRDAMLERLPSSVQSLVLV